MPVETRLSRNQLLCLKLADTLWSWLVVGPLCVFYWSGTWKIMDNYIIPESSLLSGYVSLGIGSAIGFITYFIFPLIKDCVVVQWSLHHVIISRIAIHIQNFGTLNFWRGIWQVMDGLAGTKWQVACICVGVSLGILLLLRSVSNCMAVPFIVNLDTRPDFYHTYPRFRTQSTSPCKYITDVLFSHFVVSHLVVQVWRGVWHLMDAFIWPNHRFASYMLSLGTGYATAVVLTALQYPFYLIAKRLHQTHMFLELIFEDVVKLVVVLNTLLMWHGGWGLCKDYLLTNELHFWSSHVFASVGLLLLQVASTVGVAGVAIDCHLGRGSGMIFPIDYFTHYYKSFLNRRSIQVGDADRYAASPVERECLMSADQVSSSSADNGDDLLIN